MTPFSYICLMNTKNQLRNNLIRKLQRLSADKLAEINNILNTIESQLKSKEETLKFAGVWKDLDMDFFIETTEKLHENRNNDRLIN
jgi:hypothetical protein